MKYNKLVRDKIPEIIKSRGQDLVTHIANNDEYWQKLKEKLKEEVEEFLKDSNEEELADLLEIIYTIRDFKNIDRERLEDIRKEKAGERGSFKNKIILDDVRFQDI